MLGRFGWAELLVVLLIALLVFGPGRVGKLGKELGQGIHSFQEGLKRFNLFLGVLAFF